MKSLISILLAPGLFSEFVLVEGGEFFMGGEVCSNREKPKHLVTIPSYYIGKYLVTQDVWQAITGKLPSKFEGKKRPVEQVAWDEIQQFIKKLNARTQEKFRLPTEAEWEYAARGGIYSQEFHYAGSTKLKQVGWFSENSDAETHKVGLLLGNELGIYDFSGNVWEWCEDDYHGNYIGAPIDGSAWVDCPIRGKQRTMRGGGYTYLSAFCRPTFRRSESETYRSDAVGFRLVLPCKSSR